MVGSKPDERLRTPMQWTRAPGAGFTTGRPWQQLQDDSAVTTVELQEGDSRSILALHRRVIPLRDENPALATGRLIPVVASDDAVIAYVRREGERAVLIIANVGMTPARGVSLSADGGALPRGSWRLRSLLDGDDAAPLSVAEDGRISSYMPLPSLAPLEGYAFELTRR